SNLDEFFMVRVAGLLKQLESGTLESGPDALTPAQQLEAIRHAYIQLIGEAHTCWSALIAALAEEGIAVCDYDQLNESQKAIGAQYFKQTLFPVLTPLAVDP